MSTLGQGELDSESWRSGEVGAWENTLASEGYLPVAPRHPPQLAPHSAERRLVELFATLGHEFRTPLTVINGYTTTLLRHRQHLSAPEQEEFLQIIQQAGTHLEYLMARLFEIAELEAGSVQLEWSLVDISALAREAVALAQRHVSASQHDRFTFQVQCRDEAGNQTERVPLVKGDARRLRKVLDHLLDNAIRYSPQGGSIGVIARPAPPPRLTAEHDPPGNPSSFLDICVCDFGLGIADEHLERIFEHFYRVDSSLTREVYGLGLGLTVCHYLVALHQGRIWAESCSEGGSAFHVWLPCAAKGVGEAQTESG